jgi:receptor protein-tyrosine kinase
MAETIGFVWRAAARLRGGRAERRGALAAPPADPGAGGSPPAPMTLDIGELARFGIPLPSTQRSRVAEEFRLIKRNLIRARIAAETGEHRPPSRSIMITSAGPGDGKTFVALNLALAFAAETDGEALLLDADMNHTLVEDYFRYRPESGLVDVLEGRREFAEVVLRTSVPRLSILPAGRGGPHVPELLAGKRMAALLAEMTDQHPQRAVIIDTGPCLVSSDPATLAPLVGQIVFVVAAYRTQQQEIEFGISLLESCPNISLLLNKCDRGAREHFGSYGYIDSDHYGDEPR